VTPSVHYIRFVLTPAEVAAVARGPVVLTLDHPNYRERIELDAATVTELLADLQTV
jgi:hypothetical protein